MAQLPIVTVKLEASQERELMARFFEYVFEHSMVVQDALDAIRDGSYVQYVLSEVDRRPTWRAVDGWVASPSQALSTPKVDSIGEADSTPPNHH